MVQISDPRKQNNYFCPRTPDRVLWGSCFHLNGLLPTLAKSITHIPPEIPTGI